MIELAQSEFIQNLPRLLDDLAWQPVVIQKDGKPVGALVSIEQFESYNAFAVARMQAIAERASVRVDEHARELGISSDELIERLLADG